MARSVWKGPFVELSLLKKAEDAQEAGGNKPIKTRAHGYRYKSWFRLGFDQLRSWILSQPHRAAEIWRRIWAKRKPTFQPYRVV